MVKTLEGLTIDADRRLIFKHSGTSNKRTLRELRYFNGEVPHRFLSPLFRAADAQAAYSPSQRFENQCWYALYPDHIEINPFWVDYLRLHAGILKHFCFWTWRYNFRPKTLIYPIFPTS